MILQLQQENRSISTSMTDQDVEKGDPQESKVSLDDTSSVSPANCVLQGFSGEEDSVSMRSFQLLTHRWLAIFILFFMLLVGAVSSACFLALGITNNREEQNDQFERRSSELVKEIQNAFKDYEVAGQWVQETGRKGDITREDFHALYLNLISTGLEFQVASFNPNTTTAGRAELEQEATAFYTQNYPDIDYRGVVGLEPNADGEGVSLQPRSEQPFYFPVHLLEPVEGNEGAIDFDLYSSKSRRETIHKAIDTWKPALTPRLQLVQEAEDTSTYGIILMHPGIPLPNLGDKPESFSSMVIRIPDLLKRASPHQLESTTVYIFDTSNPDVTQQFMGAARVYGENKIVSLPEVDLETALLQHERKYVEVINIVDSSEWTLVVVDVDGAYDSENGFVILAGTLILLLCAALGIFIYCNIGRMAKVNRLKTDAQQEKSMMIVENARHSAQTERELNDFIAHEVRNPLAAAMSACSFVASAVEDESNPLVGAKNRKSVIEDVGIIDSSLHFINDLLRNMLDMHRASSNQLKIDMAPTHLLHDVLQPVNSMLHLRGTNFQVLVDCPSDLVVLTDSLRLKQIVLNLARNAMKFVDQGFIRFKVRVVDNSVQLYIEDSGPGIPPEKREILFRRFQESLDSLNQGTGIGLSLCKNLTELMQAEILIDETYDSGVAGCPGTRFVVNLHSPPLQLDDSELDKYGLLVNKESDTRGLVAVDPVNENPKQELPEGLSVLFVDDDLVLRKLFTRSIKKAAPTWTIKEAANGETALKLVDTETFDVIFMDQYMASVQKQLLGTETTRALRSKGVTAKICGLSANDVEELFIEAGADSFMIKPFPCQKEALKQELVRVVVSSKQVVF